MKKVLTVLGIVLLFVAGACAPQTAPPAPVPAPAPAVTPAAGAKPAPAASAEDAAWEKVVQAAKKEGSLNIYSFSMTGDIAMVTATAFQKRYGIKVDVISGRGAEFVERIKTEQRVGQVVADIMEASSTHTLNMKMAGGTVSSKEIPVLRQKDAWRVDPLAADSEGHLLVQRSMYLLPWVNTNMVKAGQEPKSYRDLLKPEWKGKMLFPEPSVSTGAYNVFMPLIDKGFLDNNYVRSLKDQDLRFVAGTRDIAASLSRGEAHFGLLATDVDAAPFVKEGAPIRALPMEEGIAINLSAIVRVKNGPHPNAALVFMNWILGSEGQEVYSKVIGLASVRKDVPDFRHPAAAVIPQRLVLTTEESAQAQAKAFRDKVYVEMWRK
ncbi:MAG: extracellular solute-binding protein [Chloroflexi bacterium]|nr:extracellular solute-binding protein [Chloroflexota bacterium]